MATSVLQMLNGYHQIKTVKYEAVLTLLGLHANDCVHCGQFQSNWDVKWKIPFSWNAPSKNKYSFIRKPAKPPTITWNETKNLPILMTTLHLFENRMYFFWSIVRLRISFAFRMKHSEAIKAVFGFSMFYIWTSAILFFSFRSVGDHNLVGWFQLWLMNLFNLCLFS